MEEKNPDPSLRTDGLQFVNGDISMFLRMFHVMCVMCNVCDVCVCDDYMTYVKQ